jgi:hypothetical protein
MLPGFSAETRREYVHVGSTAASLRPTVSAENPGSMPADAELRSSG